jgi:putative ABC transport system ATP-binding protein
MRADLSATVAVRDLRFRYPGAAEDALAIERFDVAMGERLFVRGPSGCGKTTLLSLIAGVLLPSSGTTALFGQPWRDLSAPRRDRLRADRIGYIFQQFNLLPYLSVLDNVLLPCGFSRLRSEHAGDTGAAVRTSALGLLEQMGLGPAFARREAATLSVGQQQRVAAARALIGRPGLVIADEPTSALDEGLRESFMRVLLDACADAGSALVFVSHDARLAARFTRQVDLRALNGAMRAEPQGATA